MAAVVGAIVQLLLRARIAALIILAAAATAATVFLCRRNPPDGETIAWAAVALFGAAIIGFVHLRHFGLALLAVLSPLPGLIGIASLSRALLSTALPAVTGLIVAFFVADEMAARVAEGARPRDASFAAMRTTGKVALGVLIVAVLLPMTTLWTERMSFDWRLFAAAAAALSALLIVPLAATSLPFSETFVAAFNRMREREARAAAPLLAVAHPRWGMSTAGIALVIGVISYFGASPGAIGVGPHSLWPVLLSAAIFAAVLWWVSADWRRGLGAFLSLMFVVLPSAWACGACDNLVGLVIASFGIIAFLADRSARYVQSGDNMALASEHVIESSAGIVASTTAAAMLIVLIGDKSAMAAFVAIAASAVSALLLQPALTISIETLFPRRETVMARYRVR
jgi:hypothetical protein